MVFEKLHQNAHQCQPTKKSPKTPLCWGAKAGRKTDSRLLVSNANFWREFILDAVFRILGWRWATFNPIIQKGRYLRAGHDKSKVQGYRRLCCTAITRGLWEKHDIKQQQGAGISLSKGLKGRRYAAMFTLYWLALGFAGHWLKSLWNFNRNIQIAKYCTILWRGIE